MVQRDSGNHFLCAVGIFAGSVIFSLCGIIVGTKIESLNQYIIWTIPFEIVGFVPVIVYRIGFLWNERIMDWICIYLSGVSRTSLCWVAH